MLNLERILQLLDYRAETGTFVWKVHINPRATVGTVAGSVNANGHVNVQIDGMMYGAHQIVYFLHHGIIPPMIDHIDRDKTNNRIGNLRPCTDTQNKANIGLLKSNSSGYKGVSLNTRSGMYHAQIKINGKQTYLGRYTTPEEAAIRYNEAARKQFGEFAHLNEVLPEWLR